MFCRLCIGDCDAGMHQLYDDSGQKNGIYAVVAKFFTMQLQTLDAIDSADGGKHCARVICESCWQRIREFHAWQQELLTVQQRYERILLLPFGEFVKLEMDTDAAAAQLQKTEKLYGDEGELSENELELPLVKLSELHEVEEDTLGMSSVDHFNHDGACANDNHCYDEDGNSNNIDDDDTPLLARINEQRTSKKRKTAAKGKVARRKSNTDAASAGQQLQADKDIKVEAQEQHKRLNKTQEYDDFIAANFKKILNCTLCGHIATNFTALRVHFREAHNNDNGYVLCCEHKYYQRFHLVEHLHLHLDPQYFKCPVCGKCSGNRRNLATHIKSMHGSDPHERPFECELCHKRFAKKPILRSHMDTHVTGSKDHVCIDCGKGFVLKSRLDIHVRNVHSTVYHCVCEHCGKSCRGRYALKRHLLEHEGVDKRKWPCDQCDAELHSKFSLKRHKRLAHHDGSTAYVCSECGKVALTEEALRSHKKYVHQTERTFKCTICSKAFKAAIVLKEHMTTHTGQDLYKCPHCPKMFKVSSNMHHHRKRVHPKEWAENRRRQNFASKIDLSAVANEVIM